MHRRRQANAAASMRDRRARPGADGLHAAARQGDGATSAAGRCSALVLERTAAAPGARRRPPSPRTDLPRDDVIAGLLRARQGVPCVRGSEDDVLDRYHARRRGARRRPRPAHHRRLPADRPRGDRPAARAPAPSATTTSPASRPARCRRALGIRASPTGSTARCSRARRSTARGARAASRTTASTCRRSWAATRRCSPACARRTEDHGGERWTVDHPERPRAGAGDRRATRPPRAATGTSCSCSTASRSCGRSTRELAL